MFKLFIKANDPYVGRFFGDFANEVDPVVSKQHYIQRLAKKDRYQQCGDNAPEGTHAGCVYCYMRDQKKDKGISLKDTANFFTKDARRFHKLEEEVKEFRPGFVLGSKPPVKDVDFWMTKYPRCRGANCKHCKSGSEAKEGSFRHLELSNVPADQLVSIALEQVPTFCKCGAFTQDDTGLHQGTLVVERWLCGGCGEEVAYDPEDGEPFARCTHCKKKLPPSQEVSCTHCDNPQRCELQDFFVKVTKTGEDKTTRWSFDLVFPAKPPTEEELAEAKENYPDWEKLLAPEPAEMQAATLGIVSPFKSKKSGAMTYGELDDDAPEDDDEEVDAGIDFSRGAPSKPAAKKVLPPPPPKKKLLLKR